MKKLEHWEVQSRRGMCAITTIWRIPPESLRTPTISVVSQAPEWVYAPFGRIFIQELWRMEWVTRREPRPAQTAVQRMIGKQRFVMLPFANAWGDRERSTWLCSGTESNVLRRRHRNRKCKEYSGGHDSGQRTSGRATVAGRMVEFCSNWQKLAHSGCNKIWRSNPWISY